MSNERLTRQSSIINSSKIKEANITIVGVGGIGSHLALALARMGAENLRLIDPDVVSVENINSQGFDLSDIGKLKVDAVKQKIVRAVGVLVKTEAMLITESTQLRFRENEIWITAVDSMKARMTIVEKIYNIPIFQDKPALIINPSMAAEYLVIDTHDMNTYNWFERFKSSWFTDENAVQEDCTAKATIYTTLMTGGFISKIVKDFIMGKPHLKQLIYDIKGNSIKSMYDSDDVDMIE